MPIGPTSHPFRLRSFWLAAGYGRKAMAQVLKFQDAFGGREVETHRPERQLRTSVSGGTAAGRREDDEADDFWPEVSTRHSREAPLTANPANSPQRVLFEMFLVLAGVAVLVLATSLPVPLP